MSHYKFMKWTSVYHCPEGWSPYLIQDQILVNSIQRLSKSIQGYPSPSKYIQVIYESHTHESLSDQDQIWLRPKSTTHPINSQTLLLGNPIGFKTSYPIRILDSKIEANELPSHPKCPQNTHNTSSHQSSSAARHYTWFHNQISYQDQGYSQNVPQSVP